MRQLGFDAASQELSLAFSKVGFQSAKVDDLSQRERSEVLRPEEIHLPLAGIILIGDRAEGTALVGADVGREREVRKCFADTEHKITSSFRPLHLGHYGFSPCENGAGSPCRSRCFRISTAWISHDLEIRAWSAGAQSKPCRSVLLPMVVEECTA